MDTEIIMILLGFAALIAGQGATLLMLIIRGDRQQKENNRRFDQIDERFDQIDERFDQIDERFDQIDERFDQIDERFDQTIREIADQLTHGASRRFPGRAARPRAG